MSRAKTGQDIARERFKDPKFLKLQARWNRKLAASGFEDIEFFDARSGNYGGEGGSRGFLRGVSQEMVVRAYDAKAVDRDGVRVTAGGPAYWDACQQWLHFLEREGAPERLLEMWEMWANAERLHVIARRFRLNMKAARTVIWGVEAWMKQAVRDGTFDALVGRGEEE